MARYTWLLWALLLEAQAAAQPTDVRPLSAALLVPGGRAGLVALLGADDQELTQRVQTEVVRRGYYAQGRPSEAVGIGDCAGCHADVAAQWAGSAHRFASFNNPYYAASVDALQRERSPQQARFCAGCHDPLLLVDDRIAAGVVDRVQPAAQAGLTCLVCHSIDAVQDLRGNGNYVLRADPVPPPLGGPAAQASPHRRRLRPALLSTAEFCGACHKVGLQPEITGDRWLRGQDDYDAWQQSVAGGNGVAAIYRPPAGQRRCQDCHMPPEPGAGGHPVRSHRFLAANTALPALRQDADQQGRTAAMLRGAVSLDLAVLAGAAGPAEPSFAGVVDVALGAQVTLDVVLRNRHVGHRFPGGTGDSNQVWVEVEASSAGKLLRDDTHWLRPQAVDEQARPLQRRDVQHLRGVIYDTSLSPADPQVVRYGLDLSGLAGPEVTVRARLRYRKFTPDYAAFACADLPAGDARDRCEQPPIVDVAEATRVLRLSGGQKPPGSPAPAGGPPLWERYLDHGLGLADGLVERSGEALPSLLRAAALRPDRAEPLLGLGRLYLAQARTAEVLAACAQAEALAPDHPAAQWLRAQALYRTYQWKAALPYLERAHQLLPGDRSVLGLLARVRGLLGDARGALAAADLLLGLDPESEDGHYQRMLTLRELGRPDEAAQAERRYLYYRRPTERDQWLRAQLRQRRPDLADEDTPAHWHRLR